MKEQYIEIHTFPTLINLENSAFLDAGLAGGNYRSFSTKLNSILSGALLDESTFSARSPEQRRILQEELDSLEQKVIQNQNSINEIKELIEANKVKISELKSAREDYISGRRKKESMTETVPPFNPVKFWIASFFLLMLSIFIFLFYVAIVYKALIMEDSQIAQQFLDGKWGVNVLPHWSEVYEAMSSNLMVVFAPFVFFGFGYTFHSLLSQTNKIKYLWVTLILIVTFVLDYFLAERIHDKMNSALEIMGQPANDKFSDILIVLILGFVVYIIWSVIFHAWMEELEKRNIPARLGTIVRQLQHENVKHLAEVNELNKVNETITAEMRQKRAVLEIKSIPMSAIIKSIATYTHGWYRFISGMTDNEMKEKLLNDCELALKRFKEHNQLTNFNLTIVDK